MLLGAARNDNREEFIAVEPTCDVTRLFIYLFCDPPDGHFVAVDEVNAELGRMIPTGLGLFERLEDGGEKSASTLLLEPDPVLENEGSRVMVPVGCNPTSSCPVV